MTQPSDPPEHGTYGAYQKHLKRGETPCDDCRAAQRDYMAAYRKRQPRSGHYATAANRARARLARAHPDEYRALYLEEMTDLREHCTDDDHEETTWNA